MPKAPSPFPREGCSLKNFPCAQILEQAGLLTPERPGPLPLAVPSFRPTVKTHQRRVITTLMYLSCCLVAQSCLTLCDPRDCSLPGSSVHGISQTRILEWAAIPFSRGPSRSRGRTCVFCIGRRIFFLNRRAQESPCFQYLHMRSVAQSRLTLCDPWTIVHQPPLSMEFFSGKNTGVGCHFLLLGFTFK